MKPIALKLIVVVLLVTALVGGSQVFAFTQTDADSITVDCTGLHDPGIISQVWDRNNTNTGYEAYHYIARDGAGNQLFYFASQLPVGDVTIIGNVNWTSAPQYNPITMTLVSHAGNGYGEQSYTWIGWCAGLPTWAGSDQVPIPAGAVVGSFVATTALYTAPSADAATSLSMQAGQTLWVYGVDASGKYYQVQLAGQLLWVPVGTMGPNYDAVWNGKPLPTTVVN